MDKVLFKGIKQVTADVYNSTSSSDRIGYLWFVRNATSGTSAKNCDIFFGNRKYGHSGNEAMDIITLSGAVVGISEELGNLGLEEGQTLGDVIRQVFSDLEKKIDGVSINGKVGTVESGVSTFTLDAGDIQYNSATTVNEIINEIIERINNQLEFVLETATEETIAEGHIELKVNDNSEIYGVMYYQE